MEKTKNGLTAGKALLMGTTLISLSAVTVSEAQAASASGAMSAIILTPIAIATTPLHFGSLTVGTLGTGTATLDTADGRTTGGTAVGVTGAGLEQSGVLTITGAAAQLIDVTVGAGPFTVNAGVPTMTVDTFNVNTVAGGFTVTGIAIGGGGTVAVPIGATLHIAASQAPGTYTGAFTVDVNYQ